MLRHLARATRHDVLMALAAGLRVVGRPESIPDALHLFEDELVVVERTQRDDRVFVERVGGGPLGIEAIGAVVESGWRLAKGRARDRFRRDRALARGGRFGR